MDNLSLTKTLLFHMENSSGENLVRLLNENGHLSIWRQSKKQAIEELTNNLSIDLIVIEFGSDLSTSLQFLDFVKKSPRFNNIPVMLVCTDTPVDVIKKAIAIGANEIIITPYEDQVVLSKFESALKRGKISVLVVDDEPIILDLITRILTIERYKVYTSSSAEDAIELLQNKNIEIVITDIGLPGISGLELLAYVKQTYENIPVIVITEKKGTYNETSVTKASADGFLTKPLSNTELVKLLRIVCPRHNSKSVVLK